MNGRWKNISHLLCLVVLFTMLWTGTFWHDVFGAELLPRLAQAFHATGAASEVVNNTVLDTDECLPAGRLTFGGRSLPPPGHVHSPWLLCRFESPTARCSLPPASAVEPLPVCFASTPTLAYAPAFEPQAAKTPGSAALYIVYRSLLI